MTTTHHATDETLMRYAAGTLAAAPAIVVKAHLASCPACRARATRDVSREHGIVSLSP